MLVTYLPPKPLHRYWDAPRGIFARYPLPLAPRGLFAVTLAVIGLLSLTALAHGLAVGAAHHFHP